MLQRRKKDLIQRMLEEFFAKLQHLRQSNDGSNSDEQEAVLQDCSNFFAENFNISYADSVEEVKEKLDNLELFEQYAELLMRKFELGKNKDRNQLEKALEIVEYIQANDRSFSWSRVILKEDILRLLEQNHHSATVLNRYFKQYCSD